MRMRKREFVARDRERERGKGRNGTRFSFLIILDWLHAPWEASLCSRMNWNLTKLGRPRTPCCDCTVLRGRKVYVYPMLSVIPSVAACKLNINIQVSPAASPETEENTTIPNRGIFFSVFFFSRTRESRERVSSRLRAKRRYVSKKSERSARMRNFYVEYKFYSRYTGCSST